MGELGEAFVLTKDRTLKISDFELAVAAEAAWCGKTARSDSLVTRDPNGSFGLSLMQTGRKVRCGTPGYMAPEVYEGKAADTRSDIYSFGLVLWQMAAGSRVPCFVPADHGNLESYMRKNFEQQRAGRVPCVPGMLGPVIERCLRPSPEERYGSFAELRQVLEEIVGPKTERRNEEPYVRGQP